jgi:vacuolar-type H+-ATPase subunit F/Vma7
MTDGARLVVISPPELENGFLLGGVEVIPARNAFDADAAIHRLFEAGTTGVIAVYEPFLAALPEPRRGRLDRSIMPVVVPLPTGLEGDAASDRRARLMARLQRAIGFRVTFGEADHE